VELQHIVERYAEALAYVDRTTTFIASSRNAGKVFYQPGIQPMQEEVVVPFLDAAWQHLHPSECLMRQTECDYPSNQVPGNPKIDHIFETEALPYSQREWGIEVKRLQFVGDNGNNGDYEVAKMLSPFLKDRGVLHDALRLREYGFTRRVAVVGYGFNYDSSSLDKAAVRHTTGLASATVRNIRRLVRINGPLHFRPLVEFADAILRLRGWTIGPRAEATFEAWEHPSGGTGVVFGWEIRRPQLEPDYDARHPW
jgi:hypothetical protein